MTQSRPVRKTELFHPSFGLPTPHLRLRRGFWLELRANTKRRSLQQSVGDSPITLEDNMSESNEQVLNGYRFTTQAIDLGGTGWRAVVTYKSPVHPVGKRPETLKGERDLCYGTRSSRGRAGVGCLTDRASVQKNRTRTRATFRYAALPWLRRQEEAEPRPDWIERRYVLLRGAVLRSENRRVDEVGDLR